MKGAELDSGGLDGELSGVGRDGHPGCDQAQRETTPQGGEGQNRQEGWHGVEDGSRRDAQAQHVAVNARWRVREVGGLDGAGELEADVAAVAGRALDGRRDTHGVA